MINNLGTKLFQSVTDKAGNLGDRFEVEFAWLSRNMTVDLNVLVAEAVSLSSYVKVAIVILCVLLVLVIIRLAAFGLRCLIFKAKEWIRDLRPPPQVILMMPTEDGDFRKSSKVYTDQQTRQILERLKVDTVDETRDMPRRKDRRLGQALLHHGDD